MKKVISTAVVFCILASLASCTPRHNAYDLLCEFVTTYGAEGVIYHPAADESEDGFVYNGLLNKIYLYSGTFPENYAIFLNTRHDFSSECGVFVCTDADMLGAVEEMCLERVALLCHNDSRAFVKRCGMTVFYSTMQDRDRAERIFNEIIR